MKKKIVIVSGDPNSINSEIIFKSWKRLSINNKKNIILIGSYNLLVSQFKKLSIKVKIVKIKDIRESYPSNYIKIFDIPLVYKNPFKIKDNEASRYIYESLSLAHKLGLNKKFVKGIINCPINKRLLRSKKIGVTEFFASKCKIFDNSEVMVIYNKKLSVVPITTHISLKKVSKFISTIVLVRKITSLNLNFKKIFKKKPKIAVLGLNPHNSEYNKDSEEIKTIIPTINKLKKKGINISGTFAADTFFIKDFKKYDVIIGMYHDQILTPFKSIFHFDAINLTLGLKYIRVSPDHGPAKDLIGSNKAKYLSLSNCLKFVEKLK